MRKRHENKFTMYNAVNAFLDENRETLNSHQGMKGKAAEFRLKCDEINDYETVRRTATTGKSVSKVRARNAAITGCLGVTAAVYALSKKNDEADLEGLSDFTRSNLIIMRDMELLEVLDSVYDMAEVRIDLLAECGLTPEGLEAYRLLIEVYRTAYEKNLTGLTDRKHATKYLHELFRQGDSLLTQMDKFVDGMKDDEEEFCKKYKMARVVKNYGIRHDKEPGSDGDGNSS